MSHDEALIALSTPESLEDVTHYKLTRLVIEYRRTGKLPMLKMDFARTFASGSTYPEGVNPTFQVAIHDPEFATLEGATIGAGAVGEPWLIRIAQACCAYVANQGIIPGTATIETGIED